MRSLVWIAAFASCASAQTASIEGMVTSSVTGSALPRVHVVLKNQADNSGAQYGGETSDDGRFSITGIAAMRSYILSVARVGYATARVSLTLQRDEKRKSVELKLVPTGAISGRITDLAGEPVERASVIAEGLENKEATTDANGQFRIGGLAPGRYRVKARPDGAMLRTFNVKPEIPPDGSRQLRDAVTYYPGVLDALQARRVEVRPDSETTGADIQFVGVPFVRVSGKVFGAPVGAKQAYVTLSALRLGGGAGYPIKADGSFEFWGLDPGKYTLVAVWGERDGPRVSTAAVQIEIAGSNLDDVELRVVRDSDLDGHTLMESADTPRPNAAGTVELRPWGRIGGNSSSVDSDGTFSVPDVAAGMYFVTPSWDGVYVKSTRLGSTASEGDLVDLSNGVGGAELTVMLSTAVGSISGTVRDEKGNPAEALVILARDRGEETLFVSKSTDAQPDGSYSFASVPPGRYKAVAFPREDADSVLKPYGLMGFEDLMESVEVDPSGKVSHDFTRRDLNQ